MPFAEQLKQRKIVQWGLGFLAVAWALLQGLQFLVTTYGWPNSILRIAPIVMVGGLLLTIVLAWYHGERGRQRATALEVVLIGMIVIATSLAAIFIRDDAPDTTNSNTVTGKSVAVLPFARISADEESGYLANGIHDELLTQLAQLGDLEVISRTSMLGYKNTTKTIPQVARELGVAAVLEGSIQKSGNRVRVQAQLIDGRTDKHLWAQRYDRELTDVFAIQSDIAQEIASALQARLTQAEQASLGKKPTDNSEAYDVYLRARQYHTLPGYLPRDLEAAIEHYQRAIALDPDFALAYAQLSYAHGMYRWFGYEPGDARLPLQKEAAEKAVRLDPELAEAHFALGNYYYWGLRDYDRALAEMDKAHRLAPGNADVIMSLGAINRRMGRFDEAVRYGLKATRLAPREVTLFQDLLAQTYESLRRYEEARTAYRRALALAPGLYDAKSELAWNYVLSDGVLDSLRVLVQGPVPAERSYEDPTYDRFRFEFYSRNFPAALQAAQSANRVVENQERYFPRTLLTAWALARIDATKARAAFDSARVFLETEARRHPQDARLAIALGFSYAGLQRNADAMAQARRAHALVPVERDALMGSMVGQDAALVYAQAGASDEAIALLEKLLPLPGRVTRPEIRLNPLYDPIRQDPRFQALLR